jgi:hypothetical protein
MASGECNRVASFPIRTGEGALIRAVCLESRDMSRVTNRDIDALWGPATPQFAYQIAERIRQLISDLPAGDPVRQYGMQRLADLDRLALSTAKGAEPAH